MPAVIQGGPERPHAAAPEVQRDHRAAAGTDDAGRPLELVDVGRAADPHHARQVHAAQLVASRPYPEAAIAQCVLVSPRREPQDGRGDVGRRRVTAPWRCSSGSSGRGFRAR